MDLATAILESQLLKTQLSLRLLYDLFAFSLALGLHFCLWYLFHLKNNLANADFPHWYRQMIADRKVWAVAITAGGFFLLTTVNFLLVAFAGSAWYYRATQSWWNWQLLFAILQFIFNLLNSLLAIGFLLAVIVLLLKLVSYFRNIYLNRQEQNLLSLANQVQQPDTQQENPIEPPPQQHHN